MLIRSQDKEKLSNFNQITDLHIQNDKSIGRKEYRVVAYFIDASSVILGIYSTKEKAIKILDMIQNAYITQTTVVFEKKIHCSTTLPRAIVFEMPQDDKV